MQRSSGVRQIKKGRQKAWSYMRRNQNFRIGDILAILELSEGSLKLLVRQLHQTGYLMQVGISRDFRERQYRLVRNSGVICPVVVEKKKLWDKNLNIYFPLGGNHGRTSQQR